MDIEKFPKTLPDDEKILWNFGECAHSDDPLKLTTTFCHKHYSIKMHTHDYFEVNFVVSGKGIHYTEIGRTFVKAGNVFVIRPFDKHGYLEVEDFNVYHLCIDKNFFNKYYGDLNLLTGFPLLFGVEPKMHKQKTAYPYFCIDGEDYDCVLELFNSLDYIDHKHDMLNFLNTYGMSLMLISTLCQLYYTQISSRIQEKMQDRDEKSEKGDKYMYIFLALDYIHKNYAKQIRLEDLLKIAMMSKNVFYKEFENCVGKTPFDYINRYRILQSKRLLTETNMTITQISYTVGFYDESYFLKTYKKFEGISPSAFRETLKNNRI